MMMVKLTSSIKAGAALLVTLGAVVILDVVGA